MTNDLKLIKCNRPKFSNRRGRIWDWCEVIIKGASYRGYLDTTWGKYVYLITEDKTECYKFEMSKADDTGKGCQIQFTLDIKTDKKFIGFN